jgi:PAS domain S-box-containing protein
MTDPLLRTRASVLDALDDAVCITDAAGVIVYVNAGFEAVTGREGAACRGASLGSLLAAGEDAGVMDAIAATLATGAPWHGELWLAHADGTRILARASCSLTADGHAATLFRDITAYRAKAETSTRWASRFRTHLEASPDGIAVHRDGRLVYVNAALVVSLGHARAEDLHGAALEAVVHPDDLDPLLASRSTAEPACERRLFRKDGSVLHAELTSLPVELDGAPAYALVVRDLTARRALETQLRQVDRMVSIGTLAAGIAHEINTPIQFVGDSVHFLREALDDMFSLLTTFEGLRRAADAGGWGRAEVAAVAAEAERVDLPYLWEHGNRAVLRTLDGVERVADIVRALKEFGHPGVEEMAPTDLERAIVNTVAVARSEWRHVAEVRVLAGGIPPVLCHAASMNQVFLNLLVNAAHAVRDRVGDTGEKGDIEIRTAVEGTNVHVTVRDTGTGIPEAVRARVFDPFFTTREVGRGTGQGLAIARSIVVDKHGGTLWFETECGAGTTFHLVLPLRRTAA